jgi:hypothetical protein
MVDARENLLLDFVGEDFVYSAVAEEMTTGRAILRSTILGVVLALFMLCFLAIIIEETMLGGRRRRKMEKELREKRDADNSDNRA